MLVFKNEELISVIPANVADKEVYSHQGLTYGGFVFQDAVSFQDALEVYKESLKFFHQKSINEVHIKLLPKIYHTLPSDEIDYLLFKTNAEITRRDITSVIDAKYKLQILSSNRIRGLKKARTLNLECKEVNDFEVFWNQILIPNLKKSHNTNPVHSLFEISKLKLKFPEQIRQFNVYDKNVLVAGATVFESKHVAHVQYISANEDRQKLGSLDCLFNHLINEVFKTKKYIDFGISNVNQGKQINEGLLSWKESFGARSIVHEFYKIETKNYVELNSVML